MEGLHEALAKRILSASMEIFASEDPRVPRPERDEAYRTSSGRFSCPHCEPRLCKLYGPERLGCLPGIQDYERAYSGFESDREPRTYWKSLQRIRARYREARARGHVRDE